MAKSRGKYGLLCPRGLCGLGLILPIFSTATVFGQVYVDAGAAGLNNGTSWINAYTRLQDALSYAATHPEVTEIWVADGIYKPDQGGGQTLGNRAATFQLRSNVAIYGGFAGGETLLSQRNPSLNVAVLSGDLTGNDLAVACAAISPDCDAFGGLCVAGRCIIDDNNDENSHHIVTGSGVNAAAVLDGFTVTGGNANVAGFTNRGAGYYASAGNATLRNCIFSRNYCLLRGGGLHLRSGSDSEITGCTMELNRADEHAGGLNVFTGNARIRDCTFRHNMGGTGAGAAFVFQGTFTFADTTFLANRSAATNAPGGIEVNGTVGATFTNCSFLGNQGGIGGGMLNTSELIISIMNCRFAGNSATLGAGISRGIGDFTTFFITNSTFRANSVPGFNGGGGIYLGGQSATIRNSIFWENTDATGMTSNAQIDVQGGPNVTPVTYSVVQGGWTGAGSNNSSSNPLFVDADGIDNVTGTEDDDLRLQPGSPAIDAADTTVLPLDDDDADGDSNTTERYPFDLDGNPRVVDDPAATNTGVPESGVVVDMGPYEFPATCTSDAQCADDTPCTYQVCDGTCQFTDVIYGDIAPDPDGVVDLNDILCVLDGFGNPLVCPNADLAPCIPSGVIDLNDILAVLDAFGGADPCNCPPP